MLVSLITITKQAREPQGPRSLSFGHKWYDNTVAKGGDQA